MKPSQKLNPISRILITPMLIFSFCFAFQPINSRAENFGNIGIQPDQWSVIEKFQNNFDISNATMIQAIKLFSKDAGQTPAEVTLETLKSNPNLIEGTSAFEISLNLAKTTTVNAILVYRFTQTAKGIILSVRQILANGSRVLLRQKLSQQADVSHAVDSAIAEFERIGQVKTDGTIADTANKKAAAVSGWNTIGWMMTVIGGATTAFCAYKLFCPSSNLKGQGWTGLGKFFSFAGVGLTGAVVTIIGIVIIYKQTD